MIGKIKGSRLYSILTQKCPACHNGDCFKVKNPYRLSRLTQMHERCSFCDHKFDIESGFFYGAMYVTYGLVIAVSVGVLVGMLIFFPFLDSFQLIAIVICAIFLFAPLNFRLGRMVWMNLFTSYGRDKKQFP
jgi:hypothetical protein